MGDFPQTGRPYGELQTALGGAVVQLNQATNDVVQTAPIPDQLASSSVQFSQVMSISVEKMYLRVMIPNILGLGSNDGLLHGHCWPD